MSTKIIVRFDDICPNLNWEMFLFIKKKLQDLGIRSLLGVIPDNKDKSFLKYERKENFFDLINYYKNFGDSIAQHGTHHRYTTNSSGILKINNRSEFAGHDFDYQYNLLKKGKQILEKHDCWQPIFMAPSHSLDLNTLKALRKLRFKSISDGYGFYPYRKEEIDFIPQISSRPFNTGFGLATLCIHINSFENINVKNLLNFISLNRSRIISFEEYNNIKSNSKIISGSLNFLSRNIINSIRIFRNKN